MAHSAVWHSEAVIADALGRGPEVAHCTTDGIRFSRWRHFVGSYSLPALPSPLFVVQLAGKPDVRYWDSHSWSEATSFPGAASIVPAGRQTRWLVDGELDVATFSFDAIYGSSALPSFFEKLRFAYSDPLAAALSEQILGEMYREGTSSQNDYLEQLIAMLGKHVTSGRSASVRTRYPTSGFSSYRIHKVMNRITEDPAGRHSLSELAQVAGITESHLCRVFKQSVGMSLHNYLLKVRLDRARQLLGHAELPMSHVAELSGFAGASQFARVFRQHVGETPSSYRNRVTGEIGRA